jgi:putative copper export protein
LALIFFLAQALSSHAAATGTERASSTTLAGVAIFSVPWISDLIHLLTASAWAGGLAYMALVLFPALRASGFSSAESRGFLGQAVPRFSRLALFSVAALAVTGLYNLLIHSTDLGAILGSAYGQLLALKVGLFLLLVGLGAANLLRLSPRLRNSQDIQHGSEATVETGHPGAAGSLGRNVRLEAALTLVVFACAAGLSLLPPPSNAGASAMQAASLPTPVAAASPVLTATEQAPSLPPTPVPATASTNLAGYTFSLLTRPSIDGDQLTLTITRDASAAPPLTDVTKVLLRVTPQDIDAGSTSYPATLVGQQAAGEQTWSITEPILTLDGGYLVTAVIQRTQSPDLRAGFRLDLTQDNLLRAASSQVVEVRVTTLPSPPISGTATVNLTVVDGAGAPIDGAKVTVNPLMPAHAHAEPITQAKPVPGKPGTYTLPVNFVMTGSWLLVFTVERPGLPPMKVDASLDVLDPNATPTP